MVKIIDAFIFYNELKMLKFRLTELYEFVDYFVIVEAKHTFAGNDKQLFFKENISEFDNFKDKIIHIIVEDMPNINNAWENEYHQRRCINRGIKKIDLDDDDLIIISDCDEIINYKILLELKNNDKYLNNFNEIVNLNMEMYYYNLECVDTNIWKKSKLLTFRKYKQYNNDAQKIRMMWNSNSFSNAGWHYSYFGDVNFIKNKIKNFAHQELNNEKYLDDKKIENQIKNYDDLFFRKGAHNWKKLCIKDNKNLPRFYKMLL